MGEEEIRTAVVKSFICHKTKPESRAIDNKNVDKMSNETREY